MAEVKMIFRGSHMDGEYVLDPGDFDSLSRSEAGRMYVILHDRPIGHGVTGISDATVDVIQKRGIDAAKQSGRPSHKYKLVSRSHDEEGRSVLELEYVGAVSSKPKD
ncbi:MAG: hypothetical protein SH850_31065 [Planctomycetaceae bacterium]|nr:hypothetical protein [Planctomycetaceae bacterium]